MNEILLVGYSGHSFVVMDTLLRCNYMVVGYCEKREKEINPYNLAYLGDENDPNLLSSLNNNLKFFVAIGSNKLRAQIFRKMKNLELESIVLVDPDSSVSRMANIEEGVFISGGARINALSYIGTGCIVNTGSIIEHECMISNFSHIAPGAILAGNVRVGEKVFVGANAVLKEGIRIGHNSTIGAGSVVLEDIPENQIWVGNPAKRIK